MLQGMSSGLTRKVCISLLFIALSIPSLAQTSVDLQRVQTKVYEASENDVFRAVLSVFQNNRYQYISTDKDTGLLQATLPVETIQDTEEEQAQRMGANLVLGVLGAPLTIQGGKSGSIQRVVQASVEQRDSSTTSVRLLLLATTSEYRTNAFGISSNSTEQTEYLDRPDLYRDIFAQIDKEIFLRKSRRGPVSSSSRNVSKISAIGSVDAATGPSLTDKLLELKSLLQKGLITEDEHAAARKKIITNYK